MELGLKAKVAAITGGSEGIGFATASRLALEGASVAICARGEASLRAAAQAIRAATGAEVLTVVADIEAPEAPEHFIAETVKRFGRIDILVNNAAVFPERVPFLDVKYEDWFRVIDINLLGVFRVTQAVARVMVQAKTFGRIINISSINGQKGQIGQTNYSAAKAGEIGFTKALAQENAKLGVTVNAICPGYINTEMVQAVPKDVLEKNILPQIPVGRLGEPEDIARCVVFLASDDAGFITGSTMTVNGAQYLT